MRLRKKAIIMAMIMSMTATPIQYAGAQTVSITSMETACENEN